MLSRWYRTGVICSLDIGLFQDANGDGIGDIQGLISRLDCPPAKPAVLAPPPGPADPSR